MPRFAVRAGATFQKWKPSAAREKYAWIPIRAAARTALAACAPPGIGVGSGQLPSAEVASSRQSGEWRTAVEGKTPSKPPQDFAAAGGADAQRVSPLIAMPAASSAAPCRMAPVNHAEKSRAPDPARRTST
jgi:hypothetical protein